MDSVTSRQTSVQVPDERVRNSTGLAVRPLFSPSQIQRAKGVIPNRNSAGLTRPTASADHWTLGVAASRRVSAAVEAWGAGAPVRHARLSIGLQVHALIKGRDLIRIAIERQRLALRTEQAVLADRRSLA